MTSLLLNLIVPILIVGISWYFLWYLWHWNKRKHELEVLEDVSKAIIPHYIFGTLKDIRDKGIGEGLKDSVKAYRVVMEEDIVAIILFSTPSGLWEFRTRRGEEKELGSYSHIHYINVLEPYRKRGYFYKLMDLVISDTCRISSGITIDVSNPLLRELLKKKFEFVDCGTYMKLDYRIWK